MVAVAMDEVLNSSPDTDTHVWTAYVVEGICFHDIGHG
jgi:hypothetical protein